MQIIKRTLKQNPLYLILSQPGVYLRTLLVKTMVIGVFTLITGIIVKLLHYDSYTIPATMHGLIGIVIGLLLVFRTNTAYDRWWDGRKIISNLSTHASLISARMGAIEYSQRTVRLYDVKVTDGLRKAINEFINTLSVYLREGNDDEASLAFHMTQKNSIEQAFIELEHIGHIEHSPAIATSLNQLLECSNGLERIKNTPIPLSYVLHIKTSIFIYLMTLPFGMFHDLGLWATPLVMLVYYIIAGVEIISNEIENPFADDPNDLPTSELFATILETFNNNKK
jgi:putative membrane protein